MLTGVALTVAAAQGVPMAETAAPAVGASIGETTAVAEQPVFSEERIEQLVAPIALYPDTLLAQVLMGATYPLEIVQAARWLKRNPDLRDEALDGALLDQPWDPSVKTLVMFPDVLKRMNDNLDWTQDLGDAFLAQESDLMAAVQRLRHDAQRTGALKDTAQQKVVVEKETIVVEPADPQVVYVPTYNPTVVYGTPAPATVYYPTVYQEPAYTSSASDSVVSFGAGLLVGGLLTAAIMWDDDDDDWYDGWGYRHHIWHHGHGYWDPRWRGPRYGSNRWKSWRGDVNINGDVCIGTCINIDRREWKKQARTFEHRHEHRRGVRYKDWTNVAARHPDVATTLPARPSKRPGLGGVGDRPGFKPRPPERPDLARPDRPALATRPAVRPSIGGDKARPSKLPERPGASGDKIRPSKLPERPGASGDEARPAAAKRPADRPKPETRPAKRPTTAEARPTKDTEQARPATREVKRASQTGKGTAFQSRDASSIERQASQRGAASRGEAATKARPQTQPKAVSQPKSFSRPQSGNRSFNQAPKASSKGSAFQARSSGGMERKASQRGASSLGKGNRGGFGGRSGGGGRGGKRGR
jgi:hypothetical protein